ncbi:MAG: ABC transporter substrate-binding protein [Candidatus Baltobacteraceae bacterium]
MVTWHKGLDPYVMPFADVAERAWIFAQGLPTVASVKANAAQTEFFYALRDGVMWHDGKPLRASDVKECVHRLLRNIAWQRTFPYDRILRAEAIGARRIRIVLRQATSDFAQSFFAPYGNIAVPLIRREADRLIGTASFKIKSDGNEQTVFTRVAGTGSFDTVRLRLFGDPNGNLIALRAGEIDVLAGADRNSLDLSGFHAASRRSGVVYVLANTRGTLAAESIRSAVLAALDGPSIARLVYRAAPTNELLPGVEVVDKARKVDAKANVTIFYIKGSPLERAAAVLADRLRDSNVVPQLTGWPLQAYDAALRTGEFDLAFFGGQYTVPEDIAPDFRCEDSAPRGHNYSRVCDPRLDAALARGDKAAISQRLSADAIVRVMAPYNDHALLAPRVHIPLPRAPYVPWFDDLDRWSIS